ncbi:MAG: AgmX/PglI C-terminal domain-containing protein [Myxococcota bacterium]
MRTALEVRQTYCDTHLDTRHFRSGSVGVGSRVAWRWRFLGVDMGTVPGVLRHVLPWLPPIWSECEPVETAHFQIDDDGLESVFRHEDGRWTVQVPSDWTAEHGGLPAHGTLEIHEPVVLRKGDLVFEAALVDAPEAAPRDLPTPEPPMLASFAMMAATGLLFGLGVYFAPPLPSTSFVEVPDRISKIVMLPAPEEPKPVPTVAEAAGGGGAPSSSRSAEPDPGPRSSHAEDVATARSAGVFSDPNAMDFGGIGLDGIADAVDLLASPSGRGIAMGGMNGRGCRTCGGGGDGEGIDMPGRGPGPGVAGYGGPGFIAKPPGQPITLTQDPLVIGSVDATDVDRVIKRHLSQIRYCYQRQLPRNPDLSGKLVVKFTIAKDGRVSSASVKSSTIADSAVGDCVVGRIQRMEFVTPRGGGIAIVSYPFMFSPG